MELYAKRHQQQLPRLTFAVNFEKITTCNKGFSSVPGVVISLVQSAVADSNEFYIRPLQRRTSCHFGILHADQMGKE